MSGNLTAEQVTNEAEFREFLRQGLAEMDRLFALMAEDQKEIEKRLTGLPLPHKRTCWKLMFFKKETARSLQSSISPKS